MRKAIRCSDIYHGCEFVSHGGSDDEVMALALHHAQLQHGLSEVDWEMLVKFSDAIREESEGRND